MFTKTDHLTLLYSIFKTLYVAFFTCFPNLFFYWVNTFYNLLCASPVTDPTLHKKKSTTKIKIN